MQRIVSFLPSATEIACALGLADSIVGITHECDYPPEIASKPVVVRALGPTLARFGVSNALPDPTLSLYDGNGALLVFNDDWRDNQESSIAGTGLAPSDDLESAITGTLAPGSYTAVVRGYENATGNGLIEVYGLD